MSPFFLCVGGLRLAQAREFAVEPSDLGDKGFVLLGERGHEPGLGIHALLDVGIGGRRLLGWIGDGENGTERHYGRCLQRKIPSGGGFLSIYEMGLVEEIRIPRINVSVHRICLEHFAEADFFETGLVELGAGNRHGNRGRRCWRWFATGGASAEERNSDGERGSEVEEVSFFHGWREHSREF